MSTPDTTVPAAAPAPGSLGTGERIAKILIEAGRLTPEQLQYAQRVRAKLAGARTLLSVLQKLGYVDEAGIQETLRTRRVSVPLGALLVEFGYITEADLGAALSRQKERPGAKLGEILVESQVIPQEVIYEVLSCQLGFPNATGLLYNLDPEVARLAPLKWCRQNECLPVGREGKQVVVAFHDPFDQKSIGAAKKVFGEDLVVGVAPKPAILDAIGHLEQEALRQTAGGAVAENVVVRNVHEMIAQALQDGVSDIHVEPMKDRLRIRFRRDGVLVPYKDYPLDIAPAFLGRTKILAGADIAEKRRHQDGRILFEDRGQAIDIRVSIYVTIHGEKVVLRLLNNRNTLLDIKDVGMAPRTLERFREDALDAPSGVVIVTGPTGSGKTTTLYGAVNYLNDPQTSIITAEDPVEYVIEGISQCSINPRINLTYEETLKHIVRQDPDVIVIGEIRDQFSAETAIQAALTGHKVLTTFHTEDSMGGLLRLLNMNIEAFLISSTVVSVIAQRLVRRVCPICSTEKFLTPHEVRRLGYDPKEFGRVPFREPHGCPNCRFTGYRGRVAVFELLVLNEMVKEALIARKTSYEIRRVSTETTGLVTLLEDGIVKAVAGQTTFQEILRTLPRLSPPRPLGELRRLLGEV